MTPAASAEIPKILRRFGVERAIAVWAVLLGTLFTVLAVTVALLQRRVLELDQDLERSVHAFALSHRASLVAATLVTNAGSPVSMDLIAVAAALVLLWRGPASCWVCTTSAMYWAARYWAPPVRWAVRFRCSLPSDHGRAGIDRRHHRERSGTLA